MLNTLLRHATPTADKLHLTRLRALAAFEAVARGPVYTVVHERGNGAVTEQIDWVRTSRSHRGIISNANLEARLLLSLAAAASLGLVQMQLTAMWADASTYEVKWTCVGGA